MPPEKTSAIDVAPPLWIGIALPPASWIGDFLGRYALTRVANTHHLIWPLRLSTIIAVAMLLVGAALCWGQRRAGHSRLALWGLALAGFFLLLILAQAYPTFRLDSAEIT